VTDEQAEQVVAEAVLPHLRDDGVRYVLVRATRTHHVHAGHQPSVDRRIDTLLHRRWLPDHHRPADIGEVAVPHRTDVDEAEIAVADDLVRADPMRRRHVLA
jgi:hypothetical protein